MNDITALMATMKAAAEKATPGIWEMEQENIWYFQDGYTKHLMYVTQGDDVDDRQDHINTQYIAEVSPANVLALVEALEKAQRYIERLREWNADLAQESCEYQNRIAELESRTVTVKLPAEYLNADGSVNADMANTCPVVSAYREAHRAAGIQVIEGEGQ